MEIILSSLEVLNARNRDSLMDWPLGQRNEGVLKKGQTMKGISVWNFNGKSDQKVEVSIDAGNTGEELTLDIFDQEGKSIMPGGAVLFIGRYASELIKLPVSGDYTIQVSPTPYTDLYGWYEITMK